MIQSVDDPTLAEALRQKVNRLETTVKEQQATMEAMQAEIDELRQGQEALDARTELLSLVENSDELDGYQRSVALLQHLQKKAEAEARRGRTKSAAMDPEAAAEALHHPGIHRTTWYSDFRRCQELVGDDEVCYYDGGENARLVLNLENGDVPAKYRREGGEQ